MGRVYIPFAFLMVLAMGDVCASALAKLRLLRLQAVPLALMAVVAAVNMAGYTMLYPEVADYYRQNEYFLQYASYQIQQGQPIDSLPILQYGNIASDAWRPEESTRLTYLDPATVASIKCMYDIPQEVEITWYN